MPEVLPIPAVITSDSLDSNVQLARSLFPDDLSDASMAANILADVSQTDNPGIRQLRETRSSAEFTEWAAGYTRDCVLNVRRLLQSRQSGGGDGGLING